MIMSYRLIIQTIKFMANFLILFFFVCVASKVVEVLVLEQGEEYPLQRVCITSCNCDNTISVGVYTHKYLHYFHND